MGQEEDRTVMANPAALEAAANATKAKTIPSLVQYSGKDTGKRYILGEEDKLKAGITVGRSVNVGVTIDDPSVSREHASITQDGDDVFIEDLGSSNGTFHGENKIEGKVRLSDQDVIRLGTVSLKFYASGNIDGVIHDTIYQKATKDVGTGIYNKQYLLEAIDSEFKRSTVQDRPLSVIYFDLDHFKRVNDTYGHNAGDLVLKETADVVSGVVRKNDIFCRFGGEEFIVVLPDTDLKEAADMGERLRAAVEDHTFVFEAEVDGAKQTVNHKQTTSVGVAERDASMTAPKTLLEAADQKLYSSKEGGRNRVTV
jgi:diguanylate cyclase (GGDEF)-like protein